MSVWTCVERFVIKNVRTKLLCKLTVDKKTALYLKNKWWSLKPLLPLSNKWWTLKPYYLCRGLPGGFVNHGLYTFVDERP